MAFDVNYTHKTIRDLVSPKFSKEVEAIATLIKTNQVDKALELADAIVKKDGYAADTALAYYLVTTYYGQDQNEKAEAIAQKIYKAHPDNVMANFAHARMLLDQGEYKKSREGFDKLFKKMTADGIKEVSLAEIAENLFLVGLSYLLEDDERFAQAYVMLMDLDQDHEQAIAFSKIIALKHIGLLGDEDGCCGGDQDECCGSCEDEECEEKVGKKRPTSPSKKPTPAKKSVAKKTSKKK